MPERTGGQEKFWYVMYVSTMLVVSVLINSRSDTAYQLSDICLPSQRIPYLFEVLVTVTMLVPKNGTIPLASGTMLVGSAVEVADLPKAKVCFVVLALSTGLVVSVSPKIKVFCGTSP